MSKIADKKKPAKSGREVVYPSLVVSGEAVPEDSLVITEQIAKDLLGYEEETEQVKFGSDYLFSYPDGVKVRCTQNVSNRPLDEQHVWRLSQDLLNGHWKFNGETIIIGETGIILSGQHRLLSLIRAVREWRIGENAEHWRDKWKDPPVIKALVVFGISEAKDVTRTLDNVKPRSLADVLFADTEMFNDSTATDRAKLTSMADYAIRLLWHRTGAKNDAYSPARTHSESLEFLSSHKRIIECVKHIHEENGDNKRILNLIPLGTAAGLMYLMATANTDKAGYDGTEATLDFSLWKKAVTFWTDLASGKEGFRLVRNAIGYQFNDDGDGGGGPVSIRIALIVRAWLVWSGGNPLTDKQLGYEYETIDGVKRMVADGLQHVEEEDDEGEMRRTGRLLITPSTGGIDLGDPDEVRKQEEAAARAAKKEEERKLKDHQKALASKGKGTAPVETRGDAISRIRKDHPEKVLIFRVSDDSGWTAWGSDAIRVAKLLNLQQPELVDGLRKCFIPRAAMPKLEKQNLPLGVCGPKDGRIEYLGKYLLGGGYEPVEETTEAADPLPAIAGKIGPKPVVKPSAAPKGANGVQKPVVKAAGKGAAKPVLKGGVGK